MHDTSLKITFLPFCYHFPLSFVHIQAPSKDGIDNSDLYAMARVYGTFHGECGQSAFRSSGLYLVFLGAALPGNEPASEVLFSQQPLSSLL